ncbi:hypothetical protein ACFL1D_04575 [Candidatus Omnitrophota bacterium]
MSHSKSKLKSWMIYDRRYILPRLWSNTILTGICPFFSGEIINVSGWDDRDKQGGSYRKYFTNATAYHISNYAGERGLADASAQTDFQIDLSLPVSSEYIERFDVVFNHTTLEHIFEVKIAFDNLCKMSRDIVIVIVPFAQELHFKASFGDYWRFTPISLRRLFQENKFSVIFEAVSPFKNAGIYLLFVASRHPEKWHGKMPKWQQIKEAGCWLGYNRMGLFIKIAVKISNFFKRLVKKSMYL